MSHVFLFLFMPCDFFFVQYWTFESNNMLTLEIRFFLFPIFFLLLLLISFIVFVFLILWAISVSRISLMCKSKVIPSFMSLCLSLGILSHFLISPKYSCFWMSQSLMSGFQKRKKGKKKSGKDSGPLHLLAISSASEEGMNNKGGRYNNNGHLPLCTSEIRSSNQ